MTGEKFDQIVKNRANDRAVQKIRDFKREVCRAFQELIGCVSFYPSDNKDEYGEQCRANRLILGAILENRGIDFKDGWPHLIWDVESEAVSKELLSMMDEMQKALLASDAKEDDPTATVAEEEEDNETNQT